MARVIETAGALYSPQTRYSPQARGRSERAFSTLRDRLPKELTLAAITTVEADHTVKWRNLRLQLPPIRLRPHFA